MKFLEKYWWVILIIVLVGIGLYIWYSSKETPKTPSTTATPCTSLAGYADAIKTIEDQIDATSDWRTIVTHQPSETNSPCFGKTYEQCRRLNAVYTLKENGTIPKNCPNS